MTARVIPFFRTAAEAWAAYQVLNEEALADHRLLFDRAHIVRRAEAHEQFARLYCRETERRAEGGRL